MGEVLVTYEKHGDYYYPASTKEELHASAYQILKERFDTGHFYYKPDELYDDNSKYATSVLAKLVPDYDPDADLETRKQVLADWKATNVDVIPDEDIREQVLAKLSKAVKRQKEKRAYAKWYAELERVIAEKDGAAAYRLLMDRSDHEYERIEVEQLQEVKPLT